MMAKQYQGKIEKLDDYRWRLPRAESAGMNTDGILYADEVLFEELREDAALWQIANVACMPGIVGPALAMPDCHYGYGFPIGGVAAFDSDEGVISPGGVGYDINCGVRLLRTDLERADLAGRLEAVADAIFSTVPAGVGKEGRIGMSHGQLEEVFVNGARAVIGRGYGRPEDLAATEERGCLPGADPAGLSKRALSRALPQLATLGSGNHFIEIQVIDRIYDEQVASAFGIDAPGQVTVMIHTGSRGFGHQVCDDALDVMQKAVRKYNIELPDKQLACAPIDSPEGQQYYQNMACAANYAWANRQAITHWVREAFGKALGQGEEQLGLDQIWDVAHNIAKFEEHRVNGGSKRLCVHRKGATRAFGPGHPDVPQQYRQVGQPVLVPGDMGTASYLLVGTEAAMEQTWGSTCHGAGRQMSRTAARKSKPGERRALSSAPPAERPSPRRCQRHTRMWIAWWRSATRRASPTKSPDWCQ